MLTYPYMADTTPSSPVRCPWARQPSEIHYHDHEWGVPNRDEQHTYEMLVLEGAQAGLSWSTILNKREGYRRCFAGFDVERVARFGKREINRLLKDPSIVRNRLKVESAVSNARAVLALYEQGTSLSELFWRFVDDRPIINHFETLDDLPAQTPLSQTISRELKSRGFRFVGPTIVYAHMQATGMVNDHLVSCPRHSICAAMAEDPSRRGSPLGDG